MIYCPVCEREFGSIRVMLSHFTRMEMIKFDSQFDAYKFLMLAIDGENSLSVVDEYIAGHLSSDKIYKMGYRIVNHYLKAAGLKRSISESHNTPSYHKNMRETLRQKYGESVINPSQIPGHKEKIFAAFSKRYDGYDKYLNIKLLQMKNGYEIYRSDPERTQDQLEKGKITCLERYGVDNIFKHPDVIKSTREKNIRRISKMTTDEKRRMTSIARSAIKRDLESSIEKRIQFCLDILDIPYKKHIFVGDRNYDLLVFDNVLIEVNGDYWHANPNIYKKGDIFNADMTSEQIWAKDDYKKLLAENLGYTLITIWESDIKNRDDIELVKFIKEELSPYV